MKIDILGTPYTIEFLSHKDDEKLNSCAGYCDNSSKRIVIESASAIVTTVYNKDNLNWQQDKVLRHEIIHAFMYESGLGENCDWANNEEVVDWIAFQLPKMNKALSDINKQIS